MDCGLRGQLIKRVVARQTDDFFDNVESMWNELWYPVGDIRVQYIESTKRYIFLQDSISEVKKYARELKNNTGGFYMNRMLLLDVIYAMGVLVTNIIKVALSSRIFPDILTQSTQESAAFTFRSISFISRTLATATERAAVSGCRWRNVFLEVVMTWGLGVFFNALGCTGRKKKQKNMAHYLFKSGIIFFSREFQDYPTSPLLVIKR